MERVAADGADSRGGASSSRYGVSSGLTGRIGSGKSQKIKAEHIGSIKIMKSLVAMERVAADGASSRDGGSSSIDGSSGGVTGATAKAKEMAAAKCKK